MSRGKLHLPRPIASDHPSPASFFSQSTSLTFPTNSAEVKSFGSANYNRMQPRAQTTLVSTKPHMVKLRNQEYHAHQKNLMRLMGSTGGFAHVPEPWIRRTDKYLLFDKKEAKLKVERENDILMEKIVRITASPSALPKVGSKKSLSGGQRKRVQKQIVSDNEAIAKRIGNQ